jgi:signal peptidase I
MTKPKSAGVKPQACSDAASADGLRRRLPSPAAIRETIEELVIVFVWVFLFTTFEAEAFVIPTGSMAPTLMGCHKDLHCPKCGCLYQVNDSEPMDANGAPIATEYRTVAGTCPMCRYTALLGPGNPQHGNYPSYTGDRIEVEKFAYQLGEPQRWDVVVFKYPGDASSNFIKRLVGLPGDTVRIRHGEIWIRNGKDANGNAEFRIARKPPQKLLAMLQPVFDNDYMPQIAKYGWPARWNADAPATKNNAGAWTSDSPAIFSTDGTAGGENWLRYRHLAPSYQQWLEVESRPSRARLPEPQLITDFTAYDTNRRQASNPAPDGDALGVNWVGDLALECTAEVESPGGELICELRKGGRRFQCRFDLADGRATLSISGQDMQQWRPTAITGVRGAGRHDIRFSNCDDELLVWVDGRVVAFDAPTTYADLGNTRPDNDDLAPVGVASVGAKVKISHLRVFRDIFYGAVRGDGVPAELHDVQYEPGHALPNLPIRGPQSQDYVDFPLKADQFFVLGDNSACSKDGRLWGPEYWVSRELLIGKALFIYWPHSWNKIPYVNIPFPFFPNFARMRLVR